MQSGEKRAALKVVHVVEDCRGGVGTIVGLLAASQAGDPAVGEIHLLYDPDCVDTPLLSAPVRLHAYQSSRRPARLASVARQVRGILDAIDADVVVSHSSFPGIYTRLFAPRAPVVYCAHGWSFLQNTGRVRKIVYGLVERFLSRRTAAIINISEDEARAARLRKVEAPRNETIHHGLPPISVNPFAVDTNPARINLVFVGRNAPQKGLDILLRLFRDPRLAEIALWLVGVTSQEVAEHQPGPNVTALGWRSREEIHDIIARMDGIVVPSRWEGFGLVVLEAMRAGKPAIASAVGGMTELIHDGVTGKLIDITDEEGVIRTIEGLDKGELERWGFAAAQIFQQHYRWSDRYARWHTVIEDAARSGRV